MEERSDFESSAVQKLGYDYEYRVLMIVFKPNKSGDEEQNEVDQEQGRTYYYRPVAPSMVTDIVNADSIGRAVQKYVVGNSNIVSWKKGEDVQSFDHLKTDIRKM